MPQIKTRYKDDLYLNTSDEYWKIGSHHDLTVRDARRALAKKNFFVPKHYVKKARVIELTHRLERGLVSFDGCEDDELQLFFVARKLLRGFGYMPRDIRVVKKFLELDDDSPTGRFFATKRLMGLPAEMLVNILKFYFRGLDLPRCPKQPPITKVSREMRRIALPLFYSSCTFKIQIMQIPEYTRLHGFRYTPDPFTGRSQIALAPGNHLFYNFTNNFCVGLIRHLHIDLNCHGNHIGFDVDLSPSSKAIRLDSSTSTIRKRSLAGSVTRTLIATLILHLKQFVDTVKARDEPLKLRKEDVLAQTQQDLGPLINAFLKSNRNSLIHWGVH